MGANSCESLLQGELSLVHRPQTHDVARYMFFLLSFNHEMMFLPEEIKFFSPLKVRAKLKGQHRLCSIFLFQTANRAAT